MKRILYIEANKDGTIGGSYYSLLYLLQGLNKNKYEPHVMFFQDNPLIPEFKKLTPYVYTIDFDPSYSTPLKTFSDILKWPYHIIVDIIVKLPRIMRAINRIKPDLIHLNDSYAAIHEWMIASFLMKRKIISHDRGTRYPCSYRTKLFVRFLDAIISVSDCYKDYVIKQELKVKRVYRVYNGLDIGKMSIEMTPELRKTYYTEFGLDNKQQIVGIIGNIDRWKGQHVVLQAIKEVKLTYPDIKCLMVGSVCKGAEGYKAELDKYVQDNDLNDNIIFTGFRRDVENIINFLDILLHASIEPEPFGRVILEGMAVGMPIIATNAGGVQEIIVNGETGILIPMNDPIALANQIHYCLSNPDKAKEMGVKGRERLINVFSNDKMIKEIENIYDQILC
jgi:glycosyltransferase involved in cell wall biosynthesis